MDSRVKVINKNMVAVDFELLPLEGIDNFVPYPDISPKDECARTSEQGILVLNTQFVGFDIFRDTMIKLMNYTDKKLRTLRRKADYFTLNCIDVELDRREKQRMYKHESKH